MYLKVNKWFLFFNDSTQTIDIIHSNIFIHVRFKYAFLSFVSILLFYVLFIAVYADIPL